MINESTIETSIAQMFGDLKFNREPQGLYAPLTYMMEIGGKRIRPRLCLTAYAMFKDSFTQEILAPAAALEVFHSFTLIHDDIMDKADVRRGMPTVYKKWDENTAILSGDVMSIESYRLIAKAPAQVLPQVLELFSETAAQVCEGQQYDMDFENMKEVPMDEYIKMIGLKTAVLIACAAKIGAIIAGADEESCGHLYKFGYDLGLAFQIADDWLDTYGDTGVFGKAIGGDIINNKKTWLMTHALHKGGKLEAEGSIAPQNGRTGLLEAMGMPIGDTEERTAKINRVKEIYDALGVGEDARHEIIRLHANAMESAGMLGLSGEKYGLLQSYAEKLIGRTK